MASGIATFVAKVTDPAYWCIAVVSAIAPAVVPTPYGYVVGSLVGLALVLGLALLERADEGDLDDQAEPARPPRRTRFARPILGRRVRPAVARGLARSAF
jgi:hypothetical protein